MPIRVLFKSIFVVCLTFVGLSLFPITVKAATLSLLPTGSEIVVNNEYDLGVHLNTQGVSVSGADVLISFNSSEVTVVGITQGSIFASYPVKTFEPGLITISGLDSTFSTPYTGSDGLFATIRFKAIKTGSVNFSFVYTSGSTVDTNVVGQQAGVDLLTGVTGSNLTSVTAPLPQTAFIDDLAKDQTFFGVALIILGIVGFIDIRLDLAKVFPFLRR